MKLLIARRDPASRIQVYQTEIKKPANDQPVDAATPTHAQEPEPGMAAWRWLRTKGILVRNTATALQVLDAGFAAISSSGEVSQVALADMALLAAAGDDYLIVAHDHAKRAVNYGTVTEEKFEHFREKMTKFQGTRYRAPELIFWRVFQGCKPTNNEFHGLNLLIWPTASDADKK